MSTISASTTSTTAYKVTADTTGTLVLQTGASPTTAATFDANQNMGLGVTPSGWTNTKAIDIAAYGSVSTDTLNDANISVSWNAYATAYNAWKYKNTNAASRFAQESGKFYWYTAPSGTAGNAITFTQAMTLTADGRLGVGVTSPSCLLDVETSSGSGRQEMVRVLAGPSATNNGASLTLGSTQTLAGYLTGLQTATDGGAMVFGVQSSGAYTEAARIDSGTNLLIGTTTPGGTGTYRGLTIGGGLTGSLGVTYDYAGAVYRYNSINENGWIWWNERSTGGNVQEFFVTTSFTKVGNINCTTTATNYVTSSDYRLKENIQPMTGALAKVAQLKPCTYTWKVDGSEGQGFIAHELGEVVPQCVSGEKDAVNEDGSIDPQGIDTSFLVATLTAAIQEQQAIIETLTNRITALEAK